MPTPNYAIKQQKITESENAEYVLSDGEPDRTGDVIEAKGWEIGSFSPIALFNHNRDAIIGRWEQVKVKAGKLVGHLVLADPGTSPIVDMVRALIRQGILETVSVGFKPLESEPMDPKEPWGALRFKRQELLECSVVAVPANPRARRVAKQYLSEAEADRLFAKSGAQQEVITKASATVGKLAATKPQHRGTPMPANISEGINTKKNRIVAIKDELQAIAKRAEDNDFDLTDEDAETQQTLSVELENTERSLARLESLEKNLASSVKLDDDDPQRERQRSGGELITFERVEGSVDSFRAPGTEGDNPIRAAARKTRAFDLLVRMALVGFVAHVRHQDPMQVAMERYGRTKHIRELEAVVKATSAPAMTTVVGWAAELVGANVRALLDTIAPVSVYPRLAARGTELTFDGRNPIIIPYRQYGTVPNPADPTAPTSMDRRIAGAFVGEGNPIPVRQGLFKSLILNPYKMGVISAFTREMAFASTPAMEQIIREAIAEDTAWVLDMALLSDEAGVPGVRPPGILNGVTPLTPSAATPPSAAAMADIKALISAIVTAGGGRSVALVMNPIQAMGLTFMNEAGVFLFRDEVGRGSIMGSPLIISNTVMPGTVYCIDAGEFASGTGEPEFDVSDQATLHMDDGSYPPNFTAPDVKPIVGGTTAAPVPAVPVRSLWQTASIAVRMLMNVSWGMRRNGMVAYMEGVTW